MSKDREVIKELVITLDAVVDYTMCMQMATRYKPDSAPNMLNVCKKINEVRDKYKIRGEIDG